MHPEFQFLPRGGEMAARIMPFDGDAAPRGSPRGRSPTMRSAPSPRPGSRFPVAVWLGRDMRMPCNDACIPFLGPARQPEVRGRAGAAAAPAPADPAAADPGGSDLGRVLLVDDNRDAADSLGMLLRALGAEVRVVNDATAALRALDGHRPDAVVLDLGMPGMDGYELARRVRALPEHAGVLLVAVSGWGHEEHRRRSEAAGIDHHLVKPVDIGVLRALLRRARARRPATPAPPQDR
jgi:CheY-like chemotaxis protein